MGCLGAGGGHGPRAVFRRIFGGGFGEGGGSRGLKMGGSYLGCGFGVIGVVGVNGDGGVASSWKLVGMLY